MMAPILIYQMGKVGSTTVSKTLEENGIENYQIHYLSETKLSDVKRNYEAMGKRPPEHYRLSQKVLENGLLNSPVKIISLVRDPVARNVSAFFNNINSFLNQKPLSSISTDELVDIFLRKYPHRIAVSWFEEEFRPNTGIDILSLELNKKDGYFRFNKPNIDFLLIKVEASDITKVQALNEFVPSLNLGSLCYGNVGSEKNYSSQYERFKNEFYIPSSYIDEMYGASIIEHLYSKQDIEAMRSRWQ